MAGRMSPFGGRGSKEDEVAIGLFGDHFSHSLSGSAAMENWASAGASGARGPSGVANAPPPDISDSKEVSLNWAPPNRLTLKEKPPVFQNRVQIGRASR